MNNSSILGKSPNNFKNKKLIKEIDLFSNHLKKNLNSKHFSNYINRPTANLNRSDLNFEAKSFLMNSPTNINKNILVTSSMMLNNKKKQNKLKLVNICSKNTSVTDDSFESFKFSNY